MQSNYNINKKNQEVKPVKKVNKYVDRKSRFMELMK